MSLYEQALREKYFSDGMGRTSMGRTACGAGAISKANSTNPKDLQGIKKVPLGQVCPVAMAHESCAMLDGDLKYGFRNWREKNVVARIYIDAALRHLQSWAEGEEIAEDSGVHHLGHARACLGILLDAQETGNMIDDRAPGVFSKVASRLSEWVKNRISQTKPQQPVFLSGFTTTMQNVSDQNTRRGPYGRW